MLNFYPLMTDYLREKKIIVMLVCLLTTFANSSRLPEFDVFSLLDICKRNNRSHGKHKNGNLKRKNKHVLTLSELSIILKHSGRHMALSRLVTLSTSSLPNLNIEANKFYDRAHRLYDAALLTRFYT